MTRAFLLLLSCVRVAALLDYQMPLMMPEEFECSGIQCLEGKSLLQIHVSGPTFDLKVPGFNYLLDPELHKTMPNNATVAVPFSSGVSASVLPHHEAAFISFMQEHKRDYTQGTAAFDTRRKLFLQRLAEAASHNAKTERLWTAGVNKLADRSHEELRALMGWSGRASEGAMSEGEGMAPTFLQVNEESIHSWGHGSSRKLPGDLTWAHLNSSQFIHNQGLCGSCWAVAAVSVLQAHVEIHSPQHARPLSIQELVSCVDNPRHCGGDGACDGATAELAMDYVMHYGLSSSPESDPEAVKPEEDTVIQGKCPVRGPHPVLLSQSTDYHSQTDISSAGVRYAGQSLLQESRSVGVQAWERLPPNSYAPLMHALVERGPAAVAVFASKWFSYAHGIFDSCEKDAVIDHAVALMGYGNDEDLGAKYWLVQNSWGPEWGENGRIRLLRKPTDETDYCGIDAQPKEGTGCDGGPAQVKVCGMCGILYDTVVPHL